jgi:hypothetical protein
MSMTTVLDTLKENNEFPVVFIGSGISKRFLEGFPDWTSLLEELWRIVGRSNFYGEFNNIRARIAKEHLEYGDKELDHYSNITIGSYIEEHYNHKFNSGEIQIDGFSSKDAFDSKISPFKKAISLRFSEYSLKSNMIDEYESFKKMLAKTQIILTTNYDKFIEESYDEESNYKITKYIGQKGFFKETYGYAELYKLHGCIDSPSDIIITENDYREFENNSVLISAKIISMMMNSPIIFMGYSFTDVNVRKIIRSFTKSLTDDEIEILENKLVLIEWEKGESKFVEEVINDSDLGCKLKVIKTDNYADIYSKISSINQGIAPTEVRKYQHVIKKLIIDRGKKGALNSVLLSPEELDQLEQNLQNKNITVAIGDAKYIFQIPDIVSYCLDYLTDADEISTEIRMRFAALQTSRARFPINKLLDRDLIIASGLHAEEKEKLLQRINKCSNFKSHFDTIVSSSVFIKNTEDLSRIIESEQKKENIYETISFNIRRLDLNDVKIFIVTELRSLKERGEFKINTQFRRLMLLYDILKYKRGNA